MNYRYINSPIGEILIAGDAEGLKYVGFPSGKGDLSRRSPGTSTLTGSRT